MTEPAELSSTECLQLLEQGVLGRVAMSTPTGPRIVPVNYAVHRGAIVFRTSSYSELATYGLITDLAFEIDDIDYESHLGWSVVAIGRASRVDDPQEIREIRELGEPQPWAGGHRSLYLRLRWRQLSGRRIGGRWAREPTTSPVRRSS